MAISIVHRTVFTTASSSVPQSATIPAVTAGNTVLVMCMTPGIQAGSAHDLSGTTFAHPRGQSGSGISMIVNAPGGGTKVNFTAIVPSAAVIYELTPCTATSFTYTPSNGQLAGTPGASEVGVVMNGSGNGAYFQVVAQDATAGSYNSVSGPWVLDYTISPLPQTGASMGSVVYILNSTGTQTPTWNVTNGGAHMGVCAMGLLDNNVGPFTSVALTGGSFMDAAGNQLAYGTLRLQLTADGRAASGTGLIAAGKPVNIRLDKNGSVAGSVSVQPNDLILPLGSQYQAQTFAANGEPAWQSPHYFTVQSNSSSFNVGSITPS